jgi:hypothetical protein
VNKEKFKIFIKAKKIPIINNPIIEYVQDSRRNRLFCEIYYDNILISKGVILDFYKEFENIEVFLGEKYTHILTFDWSGKTYTKNTHFGQIVYKLKNFKNPPLENMIRENYINEIVAIFDGYVKSLLSNNVNLALDFVPSSSRLPDEIANKLSIINKVPLCNFICKSNIIQSKNLTAFDEQFFNKYNIDIDNIDKNITFLVVDDVVGTGATFCEIMYKLYNFNQKINYFLAIVKDVKR